MTGDKLRHIAFWIKAAPVNPLNRNSWIYQWSLGQLWEGNNDMKCCQIWLVKWTFHLQKWWYFPRWCFLRICCRHSCKIPVGTSFHCREPWKNQLETEPWRMEQDNNGKNIRRNMTQKCLIVTSLRCLHQSPISIFFRGAVGMKAWWVLHWFCQVAHQL